jgi:hypothetical protein
MNVLGDPPAGGPYPPPAGYRHNPAQFGPGYGQGPGYGAPPARTRNGFGIAALVLGLLTLVLSWTIIGGIVFGILALIFGLLGQTRAKRGEATNGGQSVVGLVLGIVGLLIAIGLVAFGVVSTFTSPAGRSYLQCLQQWRGDQAKTQQCVSDFDRDFGRQLGGQPPAAPPPPATSQRAPAAPPATSQPAPASTPDHNAVYRADVQVPAVTCVLPQIGTTNRQLESWVQTSVTCLDHAWQPMLASAGLPFNRPGVRRFSGNAPDRACQGDSGIGSYCAADQVISVSPDGLLNSIPGAQRPGTFLEVMAHEYGHHIQELSGIAVASDRRQADYPYRSPVWLELNRRMVDPTTMQLVSVLP